MEENKDVKKRGFLANLGIGEEKDYFIENFSMLFLSGMNVLSALESISEEIKSKTMKEVMKEMKEDIKGGTPIWMALQNSGIFPDYVISLIRIGEKSGRLPENLKVVASQQKKDRIFKAKLKSAMMYPVVVLIIAFLVGVGIAWFILPRLATVFSQLRIELPLLTRIMISFGIFIGKYGLIVVPSLIVFMGSIFYFVFAFPKTKFVGQRILLSIPAVKRLIKETELARMGFILGTLLKAGVPIVDSINSLADASTLFEYKKLYIFLAESINEGKSFQESFAEYEKSKVYIPLPIQQMIITSEQSGHLPETLISIGEIFEAKTENTTKNLATLLEPILLVVVWLGVLGVALSVIMPIYGLIGGLDKARSTSVSQKGNSVQIDDSGQIEEVDRAIEEGEALNFDVDAEIPEVVSESQGGNLEIVSVGGNTFVNVRSGPSLNDGIIERALPGETYVYKQESEGWYEIVIEVDEETGEETTGWISGDYIIIIEDQNGEI